MSVFHKSRFELEMEADFVEKLLSDPRCFFCWKDIQSQGHSELADNFVSWMGTEMIVLHAACAKRLGCHLIKDALLAEEAIERSANGPNLASS